MQQRLRPLPHYMLALLLLSIIPFARAASSAWSATPADSAWGNASNWTAGSPGIAGGGTTSTDVAGFITTSNATVSLTNAAGTATAFNIAGIDFGASGVTT